MKSTKSLFLLTLVLGFSSNIHATDSSSITVFETSRAGNSFQEVSLSTPNLPQSLEVTLNPDSLKQTIVGFGSSFTESAAYVLDQLPEEIRDDVLRACFSENGARYSLTRTHIASCDFSLNNYTYAPEKDTSLSDFSVEEDEDDLIPFILDSKNQRGADFKIIASAWTAPPWMKTNQDWNAGELLPEHYSTFARYTLKYLETYAQKGIDIWGLTPLNEPQGNGGQWESMHFTGEEMADYVGNHLGPVLKEAGSETKLFIFDQNRGEVLDYVEPFINSSAREYIDGIALHWYSSTTDYYPDVLDELNRRFPELSVFHSEGCIDVMGDDEPEGAWLKDDWYWRQEATDWGIYWAIEGQKKDHPPYRPFYRYARDVIGGLNHGFFGWVDWNLALDFKGGPNHADNFCGAPILIDTENQEVYFTPLFYCLKHFSKYMRPGAKIMSVELDSNFIMVTAAVNPDGSQVIVAFNMSEKDHSVNFKGAAIEFADALEKQSIKTYTLPASKQ